MDDGLRKFILELMNTHSYLRLATVRDNGWPQVTTVAYANDGFALYVATGADAQKVHNIGHCGKVSLTIDSDYHDWNKIRGLSMAAVAEVLRERGAMEHAITLLKKKFPIFAELGEAQHYKGWAFLKITPTLISVLDYTKGFGHTTLVRV